jgi:hypothetical protein
LDLLNNVIGGKKFSTNSNNKIVNQFTLLHNDIDENNDQENEELEDDDVKVLSCDVLIPIVESFFFFCLEI